MCATSLAETMVAIIRPKESPGKIILKANANGLKEGSIELLQNNKYGKKEQ
jgi:hypothetical protein